MVPFWRWQQSVRLLLSDVYGSSALLWVPSIEMTLIVIRPVHLENT